MRFSIILTADAQADLDGISDTRTYEAIERKIDELTTDPDKRGKALADDLRDYRSVRAAGQRYRIVYQVGMLEGVVTVVVIGIRKEGDKRDVYRVASKRLRKG
ncbi:type II toxin-antitoxin system RelE family toxin [Truepera radiovictrix]|uniref:Plasmid stabilization system n=1 Tax=Truepera radiovictrix (strain DSM 17093 / CIP 108686 / LMG 22925 / RQ-24) TaxID=649638 RepID=D7CS28_TRURR|nr:type II toxin-antitoxin system RelE/ParE family toxin [Truepera radiovictrix]ADI13560.1 plasmid stabilization system [Truepera radiovictrix DSM 17093]WMT57876.1 type II toxin-antitoxin system RelE/ParE family toxin [Truepera radiovictrix]